MQLSANKMLTTAQAAQSAPNGLDAILGAQQGSQEFSNLILSV